MVESTSALLGDFVTLYQEREFHRKRLTELKQQALQTQSETDIETNILRAQMLGMSRSRARPPGEGVARRAGTDNQEPKKRRPSTLSRPARRMRLS